MAKFTFLKANAFWKSDRFLGILMLIVVIALHATTDFIEGLERRFYDFASTSTSRQPSSQLAVIAIDAQSIASIGRWPWPGDIQARMIDRLAAVKPRSIVYTDLAVEPELDRGLRMVREIKAVLAAAEVGTSPSVAYARLTQLASEAELALDLDGPLVHSFSSAANVIIPSASPEGLQRSAAVAAAAAGVGPLNLLPDADGVVRQVPLMFNDAGKASPSLALLAVATSLQLTAADIKPNPGSPLQIGALRLKTDSAARILPQFYQGYRGKPAFAMDSFDDVLTGKTPASKYTDKIVVIGVTAAGLGSRFAVPGLPDLTSAQAIAHITSSMLNGHSIVQPVWGVWVSLAISLLAGIYLIVLLPRMPALAAAMLTFLLVIVLLGAEFGLLSGAALWLKMVLPTALLLIGHLAFLGKRVLWAMIDPPTKLEKAPIEPDRMMGLALQGQGQLDMAFERFRRAPMGEALMGDLYALALDFERRRQFNTADAVYRYMAIYNQDYKDIKSKLNPAASPLGPVKTELLGRYQVEQELGKGAMGIVYLGKDPKIGRIVAIKTMALGEEFAGRALEDARERFFREAETAGRLQHQNIVTIFDAGEDHGLAYIAMEFLKGKDLTCFCMTEQLLPVPVVLSIVARVAEALSYAHGLHVVHRDIKPANIMFDLESDTVKVTDFGIARITDSSRTKTGLVLGTPSFMSPEQLGGKKVDGRSDLYSLGVTLFQLLTGVLPFRGDSMAELMHKIANDDAPDVRNRRAELPQSLVDMLAKSLSKRPEVRYQDGAQFARDLRAVLSGAPVIDLEI